MAYERLVHQFRPFEILVRHTDTHGHWSNWRLHSAHNSTDERDQEMAKLHETNFRQYRLYLNEREHSDMYAAAIRSRPDVPTDSAMRDAFSIPVGIEPSVGREL